MLFIPMVYTSIKKACYNLVKACHSVYMNRQKIQENEMSYKTNEAWEDFYKETDPKKRLEIYERTVKETDDDGANELRRKLYEKRHTDPKNKGNEVDRGLWNMLVIPVNTKVQFKMWPGTLRELKNSLKDLGLDEIREGDETGEGAVYWEIRNIARRYFETCSGSGYGRKLFGLIESTEQEKLEKTVRDVYAMVDEIPVKFGLQEEMRVFSDAVRDEFMDQSNEAKELYIKVKNSKLT